MFGIGIFEVLVILIVAVIALGPNKLPQAIIDMVKFFRVFKKTLLEAKERFDKEIQISQLKEEALKYKNTVQDEVKKLTQEAKIDELREIRSDEIIEPFKAVESTICSDIKNTLDTLNNDVNYESTQNNTTSIQENTLSYRPKAKSKTNIKESKGKMVQKRVDSNLKKPNNKADDKVLKIE